MNNGYNLARVSTMTTGPGTITLGTAALGYLSFAQSGVPDGAVVSYGIADGINSEAGWGVYSATGPTLTRNVYRSTGAGNNTPIALSGSAQVFICPLSEDLATLLPLTGGALSGGLSFGSAVANSPTDLSRHVALFSNNYGFSITASRQNYVVTGGSHEFVIDGSDIASINADGLHAYRAGINTAGLPSQADLHVGRSAATARSYHSMTDASNGEWAYMGSWSGNVARYGTDKNGSGLIRNIQFLVGGVVQLDYGVTSPGNWKFNSPIAVGLAGPRQAYFTSTGANSASIVIDNAAGGNQSNITFQDLSSNKWQIGKQTDNTWFQRDSVNALNFLTVSIAGTLALGESSQIQIPKTGLVGFSGTSSAFPALKRVAVELQVRLADDSDYAYISAFTAAPGTSNNQLATTAFVQTAVVTGGADYLPLVGGALSGPLIVQPSNPVPYPLDIIDSGSIGRSVLRIINTPSNWGLSFDPFWPGVSFNSYHDGVNKKAYSDDYSGAFFLNPATGALTFSSGNAPGAGNPVTETDRLTITVTGLIGINNPNPTANLTVGGTASTARTYNIISDASNSEWAYLGDWGKTANVATYGTDLNGSGVARDVNFLRAGATVMSLTSAGITATDARVVVSGTVTGNHLSHVNIAGTFASSTTSPQSPLLINPIVTPTGSSGSIYSVNITPSLSGSTRIATLYGVNHNPRIEAGYTGAQTTTAAGFVAGTIANFSAGPSPATTYGFWSRSQGSVGSTGVFTNAGIRIDNINNGGSGTVTVNNYGVYVFVPGPNASAGTYNNRGIFITGNGGVGTGTHANYAIYSDSTAPIYVNARVGIKTTTPLADLHIGQAVATARSYNMTITTTNSEWAYLGDWSGNVVRYGTDNNGVGLARDVSIMRGGAESIRIGPNGYVGIKSPVPSVLLDVVAQLNQSDTIRLTNTYVSGPDVSVGATIECVGVRGDGNSTFDGRFAVGFRRTDGNPINNEYGGYLGTFGFGGQWGTDQGYVAAKHLYSASIRAMIEGPFTAANSMPTALSFRTGAVGEDIRAPNTSFGTERIRITSAGNVGIGNFPTIPPQALLHIGTAGATARSYNTMTDASNGEWAYMGDWSGNVARYGTDKNGTGAARNVQFLVGGVDQLNYGVSLANYWTALSPLYIYGLDAASGAALVLGNNGGYNSYIGSSFFNFNTYWNGSSYVYGPGSTTQWGGQYAFDPPTGVHRWSITDAGGATGAATSPVTALALKRIAGVSLLTIGTWVDFTAAFPALRANSNSLEVRLADDSNYAQLRASTLYGDTLGGLAMAYAHAQWTMSCAGTITWAGSRLSWTVRIICIPTSQPLGSWIEFNQPTTDIPAAQVYDGVARSVAGGILLNSWEALYWDHSIGGFRIVTYAGTPFTAQSSWIYVASVNGDSTLLKLGTGQQIANPGSTTNGYENKYIWNSGGQPQTASISMALGTVRNYLNYVDFNNNEFVYMGEWYAGIAYYGTGMIGSGQARDAVFQRGGVTQLTLNSLGVDAQAPIYSRGAASGFLTPERTTTTQVWGTYADVGAYRINVTGGGDVVTISTAGAITCGYLQATGRQCRAGIVGATTANVFNINWTGVPVLWIDNVNVGTITVTCDYRIKDNIVELPSTWQHVKSLRPISYTIKDNEELLSKASSDEQWGFLAHELQEVLIPSAATGYKDAPSLIQSPNLLTLLAALTKTLQEAMVRIEALET